MTIDEIIQFAIAWGPTILFLLIFFIGLLFGLIRGFRKSSILALHALIALAVCVTAYLFVVNSPNTDSMVVQYTNQFLGEGWLQNQMQVSTSNKTLTDCLIEFIPKNMEYGTALEIIFAENGAYLATLVNLAYHLVFAVVFALVYIVLIFLLYLIYFIFYPERRYKRKKLKQSTKLTKKGAIRKPYKKKRFLGSLVGATRGLVSGLVCMSFLGALFFILAGGTGESNGEKDPEYDFGNETYNTVHSVYKHIGRYGETGIFKLLNGLKDESEVPYYLFAAELVFQGNGLATDVNKELGNNIVLTRELKAYTDFSRKTFDLLLKCDTENVIKDIIANPSQDRDILAEATKIMGKPAFQNEFPTLIDEFDSNTYFINLSLSLVQTIASNIDRMGFDLSEDVQEPIMILFKDGHKSDLIPEDQNDKSPATIKVKDLINESDTKDLLKLALSVFTIQDVADKDDVQKALAISDNVLPKLRELTIFSKEQSNKDKFNPVIQRLFTYSMNRYLPKTENEELKSVTTYTALLNEAGEDKLDWIDEIQGLFDIAIGTVTIGNNVYVKDMNFETEYLDLIHNIFDETKDYYNETYEAFTTVKDILSDSSLLQLVISETGMYGMLQDEILKLSPSAYVKDDINFINIKDDEGNITNLGEVAALLNALEKACRDDDTFEILDKIIKKEVDFNDMNQSLDLFEQLSKVLVRDHSENPEVKDRVLDSLLGSEIFNSVLSGLIIDNKVLDETNNLALFIDDASLTEIDGKYVNLIRREEIENVFEALPSLITAVKPYVSETDKSIDNLIDRLDTTGALDNVLTSRIVEGTLVNAMAFALSDPSLEGYITFPEGYMLEDSRNADVDAWIQANEIKNLVNALTGSEFKIDGLMDESADKMVVVKDQLRAMADTQTEAEDNHEQGPVDKLLGSSLLHYSVSGILTKENLIEGFTIIVPTASMSDKVVQKSEIISLVKVVPDFMDRAEDQNELIKYIVTDNNKGEASILSTQPILLATVVNYLNTEILAKDDTPIVVPDTLRNDAAVDRLQNIKKNDPQSNMWVSEASTLIKSLDITVGISASTPEDPLKFDDPKWIQDRIIGNLNTISDPNLGVIYDSYIMRATLSDQIVEQLSASKDPILMENSIDKMDIYSDSYNVTKNGVTTEKKYISLDEIKGLVHAFNYLDIDLNNPTFEEIKLTSDINGIVTNSKIIKGAVTKQLSTIEQVVIPNDDLVKSGETTLYINDAAINSVLNTLVDHKMDLFGTAAEKVNIKSMSDKLQNISYNTLGIVNESSILHATAISQIVEMKKNGSLNGVVISSELENSATEIKANYYKPENAWQQYNDSNNEIASLINALGVFIDEKDKTEPIQSVINQEKIQGKVNTLTEENVTTVYTSMIMKTTLSDQIVTQLTKEGNQVLPTAVLNEMTSIYDGTYTVVGEPGTKNIITVNEVNGLIKAFQYFDINLDNPTFEEVKLTAGINDVVKQSDIIKAVVTKQLTNVSQVVIPNDDLVKSGETTLYIKDAALDDVLTTLVDNKKDLFGTDAEKVNISTMGDKLQTVTYNMLGIVNSSAILHASAINQVVVMKAEGNLDGVVITSELEKSANNIAADYYTAKNKWGINTDGNNEINTLIDALGVFITEEEKAQPIQDVISPAKIQKNLNTLNSAKITTVYTSLIMKTTLSDNIITQLSDSANPILMDGALDKMTSIYDGTYNVTESGKTVSKNIISETETNGLIEAFKYFDIDFANPKFDTVKLTEDDVNGRITKAVTGSDIIKSAVTRQLTNVSQVVIPDEDLVKESGTTLYIKNEALKPVLTTLVDNKMELFGTDAIKVDINQMGSQLSNITYNMLGIVNSSSILHASAIHQVVVMKAEGKLDGVVVTSELESSANTIAADYYTAKNKWGMNTQGNNEISTLIDALGVFITEAEKAQPIQNVISPAKIQKNLNTLDSAKVSTVYSSMIMKTTLSDNIITQLSDTANPILMDGALDKMTSIYDGTYNVTEAGKTVTKNIISETETNGLIEAFKYFEIDFEHPTFTEVKLTENDTDGRITNVVSGSDIIKSAVTRQLSNVSQVVIPNDDLVKATGTTLYINEAAINSVLTTLVAHKMDLFGTDAAKVDINTMGTKLQSITYDMLGIVNTSSILHATAIKELAKIDNPGLVLTTELVASADKIADDYYKPANAWGTYDQDNNEVKSLISALDLFVSDKKAPIKDAVTVDSIKAKVANLTDANVDTIYASAVMKASLSKQLVTSINDANILNNSIDNIGIYDGEFTSAKGNGHYVDINEVKGLVKAFKHFNVNLDNPQIDTLKLNSNLASAVTGSKIILSTVTKQLAGISAVAIPNADMDSAKSIKSNVMATLLNSLNDNKVVLFGVEPTAEDVAISAMSDRLSKISYNMLGVLNTSSILHATAIKTIIGMNGDGIDLPDALNVDIKKTYYNTDSAWGTYDKAGNEVEKLITALDVFVDNKTLPMSEAITATGVQAKLKTLTDDTKLTKVYSSLVMKHTVTTKLDGILTVDVINPAVLDFAKNGGSYYEQAEIKNLLVALPRLGVNDIAKLNVSDIQNKFFASGSAAITNDDLTEISKSTILWGAMSKQLDEVLAGQLEESIIESAKEDYKGSGIKLYRQAEILALLDALRALGINNTNMGSVDMESINLNKLSSVYGHSNILKGVITKNLDSSLPANFVKHPDAKEALAGTKVYTEAEIKALLGLVQKLGGYSGVDFANLTIDDAAIGYIKDSAILNATITKELVDPAKGLVVPSDAVLTRNDGVNVFNKLKPEELGALLVAIKDVLGGNLTDPAGAINPTNLKNENNQNSLVGSQILRATMSKIIFEAVNTNIPASAATVENIFGSDSRAVLTKKEAKAFINAVLALNSSASGFGFTPSFDTIKAFAATPEKIYTMFDSKIAAKILTDVLTASVSIPMIGNISYETLKIKSSVTNILIKDRNGASKNYAVSGKLHELNTFDSLATLNTVPTEGAKVKLMTAEDALALVEVISNPMNYLQLI